MRETILGNNIRKVPSVAVGCMRLSEKSKDEMNHFIHAALEQGAYFFDHADIYGGGMSESVFGEAFADDPSLKREDMYLQSKCGIRQGFYDFSKEHILKSVDGILKRLHTDYLDLLLLHRPDALVEPEEVAAAFDVLFESGKVRHFGVSNHKPMQIELLQKYVRQPLVVNQVQFSIPVSNLVAMVWKSIWKQPVQLITTEVCSTTAASTTLLFRHGLRFRCRHGKAVFSEATNTRN